VIRLIKRYGSRKLYDTEESRYVSLEELGSWVRQGQQVRVIDNDTSEDVSAQTLTQVILEDGKRGSSFLPSELLHELIRQGGEIVSSGVKQLNQRVDRLLQAGMESDAGTHRGRARGRANNNSRARNRIGRRDDNGRSILPFRRVGLRR